MDFEKTPCTSTNARKHIQRAYYQMQIWVQAPFRDATTTMNAESYGYVRRDGSLVPEFVTSKPDNLPDPCTCGKCARKNWCRCRIAGIKCCKYCKCRGGGGIAVRTLSQNDYSYCVFQTSYVLIRGFSS